MKRSIYSIGICQCGCGKKTQLAKRSRNGYMKGDPLKFLRGHVGRLNAISIYEDKIKTGRDGVVRKRCTSCSRYKPLTEAFNKSATRRESRRAWCKSCERRQARIFYANNSGPYKRRARAFSRKMSAWRMSEAHRIKIDNGCCICGETTLCVLDFHHLHGNSKGADGGILVTRAAHCSDRQFRNELSKCVVLCANCHRKVHARLSVIPKTTPDLALLVKPHSKEVASA